MIVFFVCVIALAFFTQGLLGFGGGLIAVPILSLFMPVQDVVTVIIIYQISMGLLLLRNWQEVAWIHIRKLLPGMVIGVTLGILTLKFVPADGLRLILAAYICLHLLRTYTKFDPLKIVIEGGGAHLSGFMGGTLNAMIGGGAPAFILYLQDKAKGYSQFRANVMAILFLSDMPRLVVIIGTGMMTKDLLLLGAMAYPGFLMALFLGQKFHDKIPQVAFFRGVGIVLACTAVSLVLKVVL